VKPGDPNASVSQQTTNGGPPVSLGDPRSPMPLPYWLAWLGFRLLFATYFRSRVFHAERVPPTGPVVLAANHASFLDPPLVGSGLHRMVNYLARDTLFPVPVVGALLRSWQVVPVDREGGGAAGLRAIFSRLLEGNLILLFPEGTRTRDGRLQPARSGIGLVVIKSTAPVIPVRVFGTYEAYGRHVRIPRPYRVMVKFGRPMWFSELRAEAQHCPKTRLREIYRQVADEIMRTITTLEPGVDHAQSP
jgi:1-acyl-sn-glycerol-3-phosphate acyltransferase